MPLLGASELDAYRRDGFLCPVRVMAPAEARRHRAALEALEAIEARPGAGGLPRPLEQYKRVNGHFVLRELYDLAAHPGVLDAVASILGPDLMVWSAEYIIKEPGTSKIVSWHQDLTYWGMGETDDEVTAWIALSAATERSGCMRFVPGSHRERIVAHTDTFSDDNLLSRGQEIAVEVDEAEAVAGALAPGEMSLHHGRIFHASGPNLSADRRIGAVIRYIRPDTPAEGPNRDYAMLVRGADRVQRRINVAPPARSFEPSAMALWEEALAAQAATLAGGAEDKTALYR